VTATQVNLKRCSRQLSYYWQHRALVEAVVQKGDQAARDLALDGLYRKISLAIAGDRTLGGLCDRITPQAPDTNVLAVEGSPQIKGAIIPHRAYLRHRRSQSLG
jgi:hypothetical protein